MLRHVLRLAVSGTVLVTLGLLFFSIHARAAFINLGTASSFAVLGGSTVTNTGSSSVHGDLGSWPGAAITGFPPGTVTGGTIHSADAVAMQAHADLQTAYNFAAAETGATDLTGQNLGGLSLTPGVYSFSSSAQLTGALTLNTLGNPNAVFVFQIGSTLTTASSASVNFINGGQGGDLFWQVGSSATLGTNTTFAGTILALSSITLTTGANLEVGRALALNGAVTMDTNKVGTSNVQVGAVPLPDSLPLLIVAMVCLGGIGWCKSQRHPTT
jgi:type VI secretion system secreted protein VgrG